MRHDMAADTSESCQSTSLLRKPVKTILTAFLFSARTFKSMTFERSWVSTFILLCMLLPAGELGLDKLEREEGEEEAARNLPNVAPQPTWVVRIKG